jgi:hypothetical protein
VAIVNRRTLSKESKIQTRPFDAARRGDAFGGWKGERKREDRGSSVDAGTGGRNKRYGSFAPFPFSVSTEVTAQCSVDSRLDSLSQLATARPPLGGFYPGAPVPVPCPHASPRWPKGFPPMPAPLAKAPRKQHILAARQRGFSKASGTDAGLCPMACYLSYPPWSSLH